MFTTVSYTVKDFIKNLCTYLVGSQEIQCDLIYPLDNKLEDITYSACLKHTIKGSSYYIHFQRDNADYAGVKIKIGTKAVLISSDHDADTVVGVELETIESSNFAHLAWYKQTFNDNIGNWLPVTVTLSFDNETIVMVVQGDPSPDVHFNQYLKSFAYIGKIDSYSSSDNVYNYGLTTSTDRNPAYKLEPETDDDGELLEPQGFYSQKFGERTATGVDDFAMIATKTYVPYQSHILALNTFHQWSSKHFVRSSAWDDKFHMTEGIVGHAYDRERGKLRRCIFGDREGLKNFNELITNTDACGNATAEKRYIFHSVNAPYSVLNNTANTMFGVALLKD